MSIGRICNREVHLAQADESIQDAANRMLDRGVGCLVVIDEAKTPIGMLTDRDLAIRAVAGGRDPAGTRVRELMTPHPRMVTEGTPIEDVLGIMRSGRMRRLPVVDIDRALVGIVAADDVIRLLVEELDDVKGLLEVQSP